MMGPNRENSWRLRGTARQVASVVAVAFICAAGLVAAIDRITGTGWDTPLLQNWSLLPQGLTVVGLLYVGRARNSKAFLLLGSLIGLIFIEEAFHVYNPLAGLLYGIARWANRWTNIRLSILSGLFIYGFVAVVGAAFLVSSYRNGLPGERRVVRNLALLLAVGGFFGGPMSTLASMSDPRKWMFVEELGEAMAYALMAGYVAGLSHVAVVARRRHPDRELIRGRP